jgi:hypothetical protein
MPSPEASRRNARKSTGPRTPEGKAVTRLNSLSHGAFATDLLLPGEDTEAFHALEAGFRAGCKPSTNREEFLVKRMILASWRLLRLAGMESRVLRAHEDAREAEHTFQRLLWALVSQKLKAPAPEPEADGPEAPVGDTIAKAWLRDANEGNAIGKLCRYQNSLERSFYRALHELEHLRQQPQPPTP